MSMFVAIGNGRIVNLDHVALAMKDSSGCVTLQIGTEDYYVDLTHARGVWNTLSLLVDSDHDDLIYGSRVRAGTEKPDVPSINNDGW